jgi:peptide/nickel transport system substrate-binding protein
MPPRPRPIVSEPPGRATAAARAIALAAGMAAAAALAPPPPARAAAALPERGGTAVLAVAADPGHLNPALSTAGPLHTVAASLYSGLVALEEDGTPRPSLAESWEASADGLAVTFRLRPGVRWHDGAPLTAADVAFSLTEVAFRHHARARAGLAPAVAAVETPDGRTVVLRLRRPHPALLRQLDVTEAPVLPRHVFEGGGDLPRHPANLRPVGTGPFRLEAHRRDEQVSMRRNPDYFLPGLPRLDRVVFRVIPDAATQANALLAGEVDALLRVAPQDLARLRARPGIAVAEHRAAPGGSNCTMTLAFNLQRPLPATPALRRAVAGAVDRGQMLERVAFGAGRVAAAPIHSGIRWATLAPPPPSGPGAPDAAAAARLLDAAGLARGGAGAAPLDLLMFPAFARWGELLRHQMAPLGLALRPRALDPAAFAEAVFARRDFDLALVSYCQGADPEIGFRRTVDSAQVGPVPFSNAAGYASAEADRLLEDAATARDEEARGEAYRALQALLLRDLPYLWLVETDFAVAWRAGVLHELAPWSGGRLAERAWRSR